MVISLLAIIWWSQTWLSTPGGKSPAQHHFFIGLIQPPASAVFVGLINVQVQYHINPYVGFLKWGYPQITHFKRIFHSKPSSYCESATTMETSICWRHIPWNLALTRTLCKIGTSKSGSNGRFLHPMIHTKWMLEIVTSMYPIHWCMDYISHFIIRYHMISLSIPFIEHLHIDLDFAHGLVYHLPSFTCCN